MRRYIFGLCCMFVLCGDASAARKFSFSFYMNGSRTYSLDPLTCVPISVALKVNDFVAKVEDVQCSEADVSSAISRGGSVEVSRKSDGYIMNIGVTKISGDCQKGRVAGPADVPLAYVDKDDIDKVLQVIRDPMTLKGSQGGCEIAATDVGGCFIYTANQPSLKQCTVYFAETGVETGADASVDTSVPAYTGGTGGDGGGGTTPGDGGGTTPGGGGTTPGGGGTTPGGGGTAPGDGGGGTTPGGGGTNPGGGGTGDTQAHCGAPGQPACSINEGNTPTGIGGLMDGLLKLVDGLGEGRQTGIDDAKSDDGKDTRVPLFAVGIPRAACVNPTVAVPFSGRVFTVEICKYVDMLSIAFEAFWIFAFAMAVMSMVGRATQKPVA